MCGITGFTGEENLALLQRMVANISYRGPDGEGFFSNGKINLAHKRLSIIDTQFGHQPMFDQKQEVSIIFNGEIYNYKELKKDYLSHYSFTNHSDTEVLLYLYLEKGESFLEYLNGMFSFAIWDQREEKLILARDRMGEKPLYYKQQNENLYFASEPKCLLEASPNKPNIDISSVSYYFYFQYLPGEHSIYENIYKLLPGHYLIWKKGTCEIKKYWNLTFGNSTHYDLSELEALLSDAVKIRLTSDVPLGVFLSGGLDSTTVAYYATQHSHERVKTFSIGFEDKSFDETYYSNLASQFLKTDHHHQQFSKNHLLELIPKIFELQDEPLADASLLPTFLLSAFTRKQVTVALGGDGSDELFGGYPTFQAHRLADLYSKIPKFLHYFPNTLIKKLPASFNNLSFDFKLKQLLKGIYQKNYWRDLEWMSAFNLEEQKKLFQPEVHPLLLNENRIDSLFSFSGDSLPENKIFNFWQKGYLTDDILVKIDRASMYNSLEARSPFLDFRIVQYMNNLSFSAKYPAWKTKYLLKKIMSVHLPKTIVYRPKKGFGVPLAKWFMTDLKSFLLDSLNQENIKSIPFLNYQFIETLVQNHLDQKQDNRIKLWSLLTFVHWYKRWI
ncbi:MAG: asparagine synthase (glutamine-hydrolyzing) [Planctomycetota bacterium]